jgi:hypothetical protein
MMRKSIRLKPCLHGGIGKLFFFVLEFRLHSFRGFRRLFPSSQPVSEHSALSMLKMARARKNAAAAAEATDSAAPSTGQKAEENVVDGT